jgi:phosphoribosylanthranilate isomerase
MGQVIEVKICGINNVEAAIAAEKFGATHLGFIFYPPSPRAITPKEAGLIASKTTSAIKRVAVLVDPTDALIENVMQNLSPNILQLHGMETPSRLFDIKEKFKLPIMKAIRVSTFNDLELSKAYESSSDMLLFDAKAPFNDKTSLPGGNGICFDWSLLQLFNSHKQWFLSGGIETDNVGDAIKISKTNALDISSGVEDKPGVKSVEKICRFMKEVTKTIKNP